MRVLLVDDSHEMRQLLAVQLCAVGEIEIVGEADNGATGVLLAGRTHPDLVVLDLEMPVMDGAEALPLLRSSSPSSVILLHTSVPLDRLPPGVADAVDGYVRKGDDLSEFVLDLRDSTRPDDDVVDLRGDGDAGP